MSTPYNPVNVEREILASVNDIGKSISVRGDAYEAYEIALLAYEKAFDIAYNEAGGAQLGRKHVAAVAVAELKEAMVIAKIAHRRAEMWGKALEMRLGGMQSVGRSVNGAYGAAGRGEGA
ncbi:hypothetical protein [Rhodococcus jostii]|uniref:hypothetical protein n=1 Tax=Rhodococcus jostii TaxID=132919 RepID=UPI00364F59E9